MPLLNINKKWLFGSILLLAIITFSCNENAQKACTEEFRSIVVTIKNPDDSIAEIDSFYMVKTLDNDTILTHNDTIYNDPFLTGIIIFTDNEMDFTNGAGSEFRLTAYQNSDLVVDELYVIRHDDCHIELVSGEVILSIP
jgi:hypothetical protein